MSRSYKHFPHCYVCACDNRTRHRKSWKQLYNRSLRRKYHKVPISDDYDDDFPPSGTTYKRMNEPWNIDDGYWYTDISDWKGEENDYYNLFVRK